MKRSTSEPARLFVISPLHQREDVSPRRRIYWAPGPYTRRIFGGIGLRTWNPPTLSPALNVEAFSTANSRRVFLVKGVATAYSCKRSQPSCSCVVEELTPIKARTLSVVSLF
ncbi:hypothetical protein AVEN_215624-1 [Araneus ventricosus]|uniref:Uncharacterized protein n=1 Tax=Araneus ventricosus TaxID=182803 RepID=A0A4Y2B747_ARAVE|nr:hypothetical protein AVEN_206520-1 [Araneus ventricosus]GBL87165.1 hypothetical protein AVEN_269929-1 [Araneus ventricosus]GBL87306.1 hypothetical protein AVEN_118868-1 [Araneus ventricosus]GBL87747.1 hypothetical protein AVEN_215624-1 [Araneus ventricosus]